jgi:DNA-binding NtrC family response regulator
VLVLKVPPLRDRAGDLGIIIDMLLERINEQSASEPGYIHKALSPAAKNFLLQRSWPGNVRELENTLRRAAVWSEGAQITEQDVLDAAFATPSPAFQIDGILGRSLEEGVDLQGIIAEVARHYISRAIEQAEGNKTKAAELVRLPSYQTLSNWMARYDVR